MLREIGHPISGYLLGLAATIALPSVVLLMMFGQTRIFFVMARDGLLPKGLSAVHPRFKTPWVSLGVMILRITDKTRVRPFRTPLLFVVAPLSILGCLVLFFSLGIQSKVLFFVWALLGLVLYFCYGFWRSNVRHGVVDTVDLDDSASGQPPA